MMQPSAMPARSFKTIRAVFALMLREMSTTYGRSSMGYIWAIAEPVAGTALITLVFSMLLRTPPLGSNFALYYASGLIPFLIFTDMSAKISQTINFSRPLLYYPRVTFMDALVARVLLNGLTHLVVTAIILSGLITLYGVSVILTFPAIGLSFVMALVLALGVGTMNCFLFWVMPSWRSVWSILTRPLFIISCIFFSFESIPMPFRGWLWYNPLVHITGQMRKGIYSTYDGSYVSCLYFFSVSGGLILAGLFLLRRFHRDMLNS